MVKSQSQSQGSNTRINETENGYVEEKVTLIERIPHLKRFCLCFSLRFGSLFIGISGIILGSVSFLAYLLFIGRSELNLVTVIMLMMMALFALANIMFIIGSVLLVVATCVESPDLIPAYIWISIIYWMIQLILGIFIPIILILEGGKSFFIGLERQTNTHRRKLSGDS
ncbi:uncharacterized protein LOC125235246 [Leguminivora glycinivorella]|uniref:uncharacterized protein LOC125235246 n=1 Tax=Leguminivora glycinivorella TaxID=1035111 RepID=UPI00200C4397|nr:uncharacterized protein LOC125235246 [Leguminivora glycinivorella]